MLLCLFWRGWAAMLYTWFSLSPYNLRTVSTEQPCQWILLVVVVAVVVGVVVLVVVAVVVVVVAVAAAVVAYAVVGCWCFCC